MDVIDPATGARARTYDEHDAEEVERRVERAVGAYPSWRRTPIAERSERMRAAADLLRGERAALARRMTEEMGKPITEAEAEVDKCAWVCDYFAEAAAGFLAEEPVATDAAASFVRYDPLGPVLAVMPWNFPLWQVFRFAAPALMAGNVGLLKHASNVPGCALDIERLFAGAGFPEGVFTTLLVPSSAVEGLIAHPAVRAVTLTGSEPAGEAVARQAGAALKKTVLELGGSDPFIVLADADPRAAAEAAARARTLNSGQSCIAAKRFLVVEEIAEDFELHLVEAMEGLEVGDPMRRETAVGPLAREDLREDLHDQVTRSIEAGAELLTGGRPLDGPGWYYAPTVLSRVRPGMAAFDEETFGPVAAVVRASDTAECIELANRSTYGLGASLWTGDAEAGSVFVNEIVKSDPRLPFGGVKRSGYGRELARFGIREFVNVKTVWVA